MLIWILRAVFYASACVAAAGMWMQTSDLPDLVVLLPDKVWHAAIYAGLTLLARLAYPQSALWRVAAGVLMFSIGVELGQGVGATGRQVDALDTLANLAGVLAGAALGGALLWGWRRARKAGAQHG
jgi:hypothetical protein